MKYKKYNDYELLYMVRENDEDSFKELLNKYYPIIKSVSIGYYNKYKDYGYDLEDFIQEGLFAFNRAIKTFNENKNALFYTYLCVCLHKKFGSYCRTFNSYTKSLSNSYFSSLDDIQIADNSINIDKTIDFKAICERLRQILLNLSFDEACIYELKMNNFKYKEISSLLDIDIRNVQSKYNKVIKIINSKLINY